MKTRKLSLPCPLCNSTDVFYSCEPKCCFNHVCNDCHGTFEPVARLAGGKLSGVEPPDPLPGDSDATVSCAKCESIAVYVTADNRLVCGDCGVILELEITEIAAP